MTLALETIPDDEFIEKFENLSLDKIYFNHLGHLRISWLYLNKFTQEVALTKVCDGIQNYATSLGAKQKFHLTITDSLVRIMAKRISKMPYKNWSLFLTENTDLVDDCLAVLGQYFSHDILFSEKARTVLVSADKQPI